MTRLAKTEGSRGGHVIGHTASGRPIYADAHAHATVYHRFEPRDHAAALALHGKLAEGEGTSRERAQEHREIAASHRRAYQHLTSPGGKLRSWAQQWESFARSAPESRPLPGQRARATLRDYLGERCGDG